MTDWDDAYANAAYIPDSARWPDAWTVPAQQYRAAMLAVRRARLDLGYGPGPRHRLDLFLPGGTPRGLLVFVHGGYWLAFDKSAWSHFASGAVERGFAVAIPSYHLCPDVRIADIVRDVAAATAHAGALIDGPIMVAGHSAGGQIAARLGTSTTPLTSMIQQRLKRIASISGLHDLTPLMGTRMNEALRLDQDEVLRESPAMLVPLRQVTVTAWVGAEERPEFRRQSAMLARAWPESRLIEAAGRHHFDVLDPMTEPNSLMTTVLLGLDGVASTGQSHMGKG